MSRAPRAESRARAMALREEGLTYPQIAERLGFHPDYVGALIREGDESKRVRERRRLNKQAPPRDADYDVSGADGVRFVVIPVSIPSASPQDNGEGGRPGWTVFDTAAKQRAGALTCAYSLAAQRAETLNLADREEAA